MKTTIIYIKPSTYYGAFVNNDDESIREIKLLKNQFNGTGYKIIFLPENSRVEQFDESSSLIVHANTAGMGKEKAKKLTDAIKDEVSQVFPNNAVLPITSKNDVVITTLENDNIYLSNYKLDRTDNFKVFFSKEKIPDLNYQKELKNICNEYYASYISNLCQECEVIENSKGFIVKLVYYDVEQLQTANYIRTRLFDERNDYYIYIVGFVGNGKNISLKYCIPLKNTTSTISTKMSILENHPMEYHVEIKPQETYTVFL